MPRFDRDRPATGWSTFAVWQFSPGLRIVPATRAAVVAGKICTTHAALHHAPCGGGCEPVLPVRRVRRGGAHAPARGRGHQLRTAVCIWKASRSSGCARAGSCHRILGRRGVQFPEEAEVRELFIERHALGKLDVTERILRVTFSRTPNGAPRYAGPKVCCGRSSPRWAHERTMNRRFELRCPVADPRASAGSLGSVILRPV